MLADDSDHTGLPEAELLPKAKRHVADDVDGLRVVREAIGAIGNLNLRLDVCVTCELWSGPLRDRYFLTSFRERPNLVGSLSPLVKVVRLSIRTILLNGFCQLSKLTKLEIDDLATSRATFPIWKVLCNIAHKWHY